MRLRQKREHDTQGIRIMIAKQPVDIRMGHGPDRHCLDQQAMSRRRQLKPPIAPVPAIHFHFEKAASFERLDIGGERRAVDGKERRDLAHGWRLRLVERHEKRELSLCDSDRPQCLIEAARQRPCRSLHLQAQAMITHVMRNFEAEQFAV
jgi:hypothetical protein